MQVVHIPRHGGPEVLELVDLPRPEPGPGQVLARVLAISVNHLDLWVRRGMPGVKLPLPLIPGCDGTGEVVALGEGVEGLEVGQRIVLEPGFNDDLTSEWVLRELEHFAADYQIRGEHGDGFACEFVALPARYARPLPTGVDPVQGAAAPLVFLTAWGMLHVRAKLQAGETVLVLAGSSGVGTAAIQLARDAGARVLSTAGSESKRSLVRELGAEEVFDHGDPDWPKAVRAAAGRRGVDVVVEHVGPATWAGSMKVLARNGRLVTCGGTTGPKVEVLLPHLFMKNLTLLGSTMGPRASLDPIFAGLADGRWKTVVDRILPLSKVREAHEALEARGVSGKIVLLPGE